MSWIGTGRARPFGRCAWLTMADRSCCAWSGGAWLPLLARGDLRAVKGPGLQDHRYQAFCLIAKLGWVAGSVPGRIAAMRPECSLAAGLVRRRPSLATNVARRGACRS